jgi:TPP-dependent indolepyruvate ferredoxin oxidoreductase alpha subunit
MLNVYLPGKSPENQPFVYRFTKKMKKLDWPFYSRKWRNWLEEDAEFDLELETENTFKMLKLFKKKGLGIIAKSIGAVIMIKIFEQYKFDLEYLVLMGIPKSVSDEELEELINYYADKTIIIQNNPDPISDTERIKGLTESIGIQKLVIKESDDHVYEYREELLEIMREYNS